MEKGISVCIAQMDVVAGDPRRNTRKMLEIIKENREADLVLFSELCIPGYLLGDMWERPDFLEECEACGKEVIAASQGLAVAFGNVKTAPRYKNEDGRVRKYNACYIAQNGQLVTTVTKTLQPNYREFDDNRHFYDKRKQLMDAYLEMSLSNQTFDDIRGLQSGIAGGVHLPETTQPTKRPLCSFAEWMDKAYEPSIKINGLDIGFLLCEDGWDTDYTFSPIEILAPKCDMVVNISCSPFTMGKNYKRNRIFSEKARQHKTVIIYVNNVGIQNNGKTVYTFDGSSCAYDKEGNVNNLFCTFEETDATIHFDLDEVFDHSDNQVDGIETMHEALTYGMKKFMEQLGIKKVVIGASGGIDSAVVAALMVEVLKDPKDLYLVNMPSRFNSQTTKDLAKELADNLGCNYNVIPIEESIASTRYQLVSNGFSCNQLTFENIQARDRSSRVLAAIASSVGGVFTCNANKSEATVGYTTLYGDLGGFLAPIIDLWKTQVYELAKYINRGRNIIPQGIIDVIPSAELSEDQSIDAGKGDPIIYTYHDLLFKSWVERWNRATPADILQWAIDDELEGQLGYEDGDIVAKYFKGDRKAFVLDLERWWNLYDGFAYAKRIQAPPVLAISRRAYGWDLRESQKTPFYSHKYFELRKKFLGEEISDKEIFDNMMKMGERVIFGMASQAKIDAENCKTKEEAVKAIMVKLYDFDPEGE